MQIRFGQSQVMGECPRVLYDSEDGAIEAVPTETNGAEFALAAGNVNLTDNPLAGLNDNARKFVSRHASKIVIAALQLEIGVADAGAQHADYRKATRRVRHRHGSQRNVPGIQINGLLSYQRFLLPPKSRWRPPPPPSPVRSRFSG